MPTGQELVGTGQIEEPSVELEVAQDPELSLGTQVQPNERQSIFRAADQHTVVGKLRTLEQVLPMGDEQINTERLSGQVRPSRRSSCSRRPTLGSASFSTSVSIITSSLRRGGRGRKSWSSGLNSSGQSRRLLPNFLSDTRFSTVPSPVRPRVGGLLPRSYFVPVPPLLRG